MKKVNNPKKKALYVLTSNSLDDKNYAIQGKYKKNLDKYMSWYGKLINAPPDIMVIGYPYTITPYGIIEVDESSPVLLKVKELKNTWGKIVNDYPRKYKPKAHKCIKNGNLELGFKLT
jgi:hypothetical protein